MIVSSWLRYVFLMLFSLNTFQIAFTKATSFINDGKNNENEVENEMYGSKIRTSLNEAKETSTGKTKLIESPKKRRLNFDDINKLLKGVSVTLPDLETRQDLGGFLGSVLVSIQSLTCGEFNIGNIALSHEVASMRRVTVTIDVSGIDTFCSFGWRYEYGIASDSGEGSIDINEIALIEVVTVTSDNYNVLPPHDITHVSCSSSVEINEINISGLPGALNDVIEALVVDAMEDAIKSAICETTKSIIPSLKPLVTGMSNTVSSYSNAPTTTSSFDPLSGQNSLSSVIPPTVELVDFSDNDFMNNDRIVKALFDYSETLGLSITDPNEPSTVDLSINVWSRENLLNSNQVISYSTNDMDLSNDGVILAVVNSQFSLITNVESVEIRGIDSVNFVESPVVIAPQTLQTNIYWDFLEVKLKMKADVRVRAGLDINQIVETFDIIFQVRNVQVYTSLLAAMDQSKYDNLQTEMILQSPYLFSCMLSTKQAIDVTELNVMDFEYQRPIVEGFESTGMGDLATSGLNAMHDMYVQAINRAVPNFFAIDGQAILENIALDYVNDSSNLNCPVFETDAPTESPTINVETINPTMTMTEFPSFNPLTMPPSSSTPTTLDLELVLTTNSTIFPSDILSLSPSDSPTVSPSDSLTFSPSDTPTVSPSDSLTFSPSDNPTILPTRLPTALPSHDPSLSPSEIPSMSLTNIPSFASDSPSLLPTNIPSFFTSENPSNMPSLEISVEPTDILPKNQASISSEETSYGSRINTYTQSFVCFMSSFLLFFWI